jgi:hypothetical protein
LRGGLLPFSALSAIPAVTALSALVGEGCNQKRFRLFDRFQGPFATFSVAQTGRITESPKQNNQRHSCSGR